MRSHASARSPPSPDPTPGAHRHRSAAPPATASRPPPENVTQTATKPLNNALASHNPRTNQPTPTDNQSARSPSHPTQLFGGFRLKQRRLSRRALLITLGPAQAAGLTLTATVGQRQYTTTIN
jgi:hypothetical protein